MAIKLLLMSGYGMRRHNWAREAKHVRRHVDWIDEVLVSTGNRLAPYDQRAGEILRDIGAKIQHEDRLIIIGHSFGGIVARYMTSQRLLNPAAIITIATPHHGVEYADLYQQATQGLPILGPLVKGGYDIFTQLAGTDARAPEQLTTAAMQAFNVAHPDRPDVLYQSYGCATEQVSPWLWLMAAGLTARTRLPNDGLITLPSTQWGEYMGTVTCDHNEVIGWRGPNQFDSAQFMLDILRRLPSTVKMGQGAAERS